MTNYKDRLKIPIDGDDIKLYTKTNLLIAKGYNRIVLGGRGPYIEFDDSQVKMKNCFIPKEEAWRQLSDTAYYIEYRTDRDYVKVYKQLRIVNYADYIVGLYYISPFDLYIKDGIIIKSLRKTRVK